jgi:hypothetical protein
MHVNDSLNIQSESISAWHPLEEKVFLVIEMKDRWNGPLLGRSRRYHALRELRGLDSLYHALRELRGLDFLHRFMSFLQIFCELSYDFAFGFDLAKRFGFCSNLSLGVGCLSEERSVLLGWFLWGTVLFDSVLLGWVLWGSDLFGWVLWGSVLLDSVPLHWG